MKKLRKSSYSSWLILFELRASWRIFGMMHSIDINDFRNTIFMIVSRPHVQIQNIMLFFGRTAFHDHNTASSILCFI